MPNNSVSRRPCWQWSCAGLDGGQSVPPGAASAGWKGHVAVQTQRGKRGGWLPAGRVPGTLRETTLPGLGLSIVCQRARKSSQNERTRHKVTQVNLKGRPLMKAGLIPAKDAASESHERISDKAKLRNTRQNKWVYHLTKRQGCKGQEKTEEYFQIKETEETW